MIDMIFAQLNLQIRERIGRCSFNTFQELLAKAREIEMIMKENKQERVEHTAKF